MFDTVVRITSRGLFYEEVKCEPEDIDAIWDRLSIDEREKYLLNSKNWLQALQETSPATYDYVMNNYDADV